MAIPTKSFRPSPTVEKALSLNGGGTGLSHRLSQIADRYCEILRRTRLPDFTESETSLLHDACNGVWHEPASTIRGALAQGVEDAIDLDGLDEKWSVDGLALIEKLRGLDFIQEVKLVEDIERYWSDASPS